MHPVLVEVSYESIMTDRGKNAQEAARERLAEIFAGMNLSELPAMSAHVRELISLTRSADSAAYQLAKVILKDYSLTNKVLQVVNSAYYALEKPVTSISRAVTLLGFDAVRDLAMAIAIFEDFVRSGVEKEGISKVLARSFLSGLGAREIVRRKEIAVSGEEAFICALLHNLGRIIVCVYLPDRYGRVEELIAAGNERTAAEREALDGLDFETVGREIARFWNLGDTLIAAMAKEPPPPRSPDDAAACLAGLAALSNSLIDCVCDGGDLAAVLARHERLAAIDPDEAVKVVAAAIEASEEISGTMRYGIALLRVRSRLELIRKEVEADGGAPGKGSGDGLDGLPLARGKSVNDFIRELTEILTSEFEINDFYVNLLEGLYRGIGFDRVVLAVVRPEKDGHVLVGRFGLGDLDPAAVRAIRHPVAGGDPLAAAVRECRDLATEGRAPGLSPGFAALARDRRAWFLPVCLNGKAIALIYLDREMRRPPPDQAEMKSVRLFRDLAVMALQKMAFFG